MFSHFFILTIVFTAYAIPRNNSLANSSEFIVIGDWGFLPDPSNFKTVMSAISDYTDKNPIDYFMTVGDNIYQGGISKVGDKAFDEAMDLIRSHKNLEDIPMYSVLGNHDCYGNPFAQVEMSGSRGYMMPSDYYAKHFDVDNDG